MSPVLKKEVKYMKILWSVKNNGHILIKMFAIINNEEFGTTYAMLLGKSLFLLNFNNNRDI